VPVALDKATQKHVGMEAVVDKDSASALLAKEIMADWLLILTDEDAVYDPEQW
jgi:carbamate kinase